MNFYTDPHLLARHGRNPHVWCEAFAPKLWSLLPEQARHGHCTTAAAIAARYLPSFQDGILFACVGLVLGVRFSENPLYPQFHAALLSQDDRTPDEIRIELGNALVSYWQQIAGDKRK